MDVNVWLNFSESSFVLVITKVIICCVVCCLFGLVVFRCIDLIYFELVKLVNSSIVQFSGPLSVCHL